MRLASVLGLLWLALAGPGVAAVPPRPCSEPNVVVSASDPEDFETGCRGAAAAAEFLAGSGLETRITVDIAFVDAMPEVVAGAPSVGCYVRSDERIYVLTFARCRTMHMQHGVEIDRSVHQGLVAHEAAHRIVLAARRPQPISAIALEYIAYVTMYATMPPAHRERVLQQIPGQGFDSELEINVTMYMLDPVLFGAQAWRHYARPGNGRAYLASVLRGQVLADDETR